MDIIIKELDNLILHYDFNEKFTDVACYNKIKMDYLLMLTIAATWDLKYASMNKKDLHVVMNCLQKPEIGKLIRLIDSCFNLDKSIVNIFDLYREGRNLRFGHTTFDKFEAERLNNECKQCWNALMQLQATSDINSELIRKLYQKDNYFYYIDSIKQNNDMLVRQLGSKNILRPISKSLIRARTSNKDNDINEGDLFLAVDDHFIKVSPYIQYSDKEQLFIMLMDIETSPLAFKMAYVYRTQYAKESVIYLDEFPVELRKFFPEETKKLSKNGVSLNKFSQYKLFEQEYYQGIHQEVQNQLDAFITGNMAYGAVRGVGGVGKTSAVFMWINRVLNNENKVLDSIRQNFNLHSIIFLSAKRKIYSREVNEEDYSNFYNVEGDVSNYKDIIEHTYAIFHPTEKAGVTFEDKVEYIKNYANHTYGILIIIDDYESLPKESREKIQKLKDALNPHMIKMLITTRFTSKESKDIIVERLNENACAKMTDHIFHSREWRTDLNTSQMHILTGGLPLLIWYAKAYFQTGQLSSERLKDNFSGPTEGLDGYLYDNFVQCFEDEFTKNFLMIATRYYKLHNILQISKKTAIFLCLKESKEYKTEYEEFYFQELTDLKLISINQTSNFIDFSPLMIYMDKCTKTQEPQEQYQEDNLKILAQLNEENNKDLYAVIEATEYLEHETKYRVLERMVNFSQNDEQIKVSAIEKIFAISQEKIKLYEENMHIFHNNPQLIDAMINHLLDNTSAIKGNYKLILDFLYSISVSMENQDLMESITSKGIDLICELLIQSLDERESENKNITNPELKRRTILFRELAIKFIYRINDSEKKQIYIDKINDIINSIRIYCAVDIIDNFSQKFYP